MTDFEITTNNTCEAVSTFHGYVPVPLGGSLFITYYSMTMCFLTLLGADRTMRRGWHLVAAGCFLFYLIPHLCFVADYRSRYHESFGLCVDLVLVGGCWLQKKIKKEVPLAFAEN